MIRAVRLSPRAWRDLERLADFLAEKSPRASDRAKASIWTAIRKLDRLAERGAMTGPPGVRRLIVPFGRHGYVVIYLVEAASVTILRVFHGREDR